MGVDKINANSDLHQVPNQPVAAAPSPTSNSSTLPAGGTFSQQRQAHRYSLPTPRTNHHSPAYHFVKPHLPFPHWWTQRKKSERPNRRKHERDKQHRSIRAPHPENQPKPIQKSVRRVHEEEVSAGLLLPVLDAVELVDAGSEVRRVPSEGDAQQVQEGVHPRKQALRRVRGRLLAGK